MPDLIDRYLGRYHILEQLGEGGMATVYKAYDTGLEREVAIKVMRTERLTIENTPKALKRFEREAKSLAKLTHPNIVSVSDYGEFDGRPYLVMPYLPGGTLKDRLGTPIPWQEAVQMLLPIAEALDYAHSKNMIHRDVKPSNILFTQRSQPMLVDFGIAKALDLEETVDLTGTSAAMGTPEYMAPEQATAKTVDHRVDIYSLGIVFYEMITGRKPYTADTPMAVLIKQATDPLPRPKTYVPGLPDEVEKVLLKALAKRPDDRYQDMLDFSKALERLLIGKTNYVPEARRTAQVQSNEGMVDARTMTETHIGPDLSSDMPNSGRTNTAFRGWLWGIGLILICGFFLVIGLIIFILPSLLKSAPVAKVSTPTIVISNNTINSSVTGSGLVTFTDRNKYYSIEVPSDWIHTQSSGDHYYIDTFTSPDKKAVVENIVYDDGTAFNDPETGKFALQILNQNYSSTGKEGDIKVTDDSIQQDGSERLTWTSNAGRYSGLSYFEVRNKTAFLMFTVDWGNDSQSTYIDLLDKVVSSYQRP